MGSCWRLDSFYLILGPETRNRMDPGTSPGRRGGGASPVGSG